MSTDGPQDGPTPHDELPTRTPLSASLVVRTAVEWVEDANLGTLSMRRLGQVLGVEAMSLYRYVPSRDELLDAMVELIMDGVATTEGAEPFEAVEWDVYVSRLARGVRQVALTYPHTFPMVITRPPAVSWLRPPLHRLRWVEGFFSVLDASGFTDDAAVHAYRMLNSFLLGHLLIETVGSHAAPPRGHAQAQHTSTGIETDALAAYPHLARMRHKLIEDRDEREFEESLKDLVGRMSMTRT